MNRKVSFYIVVLVFVCFFLNGCHHWVSTGSSSEATHGLPLKLWEESYLTKVVEEVFEIEGIDRSYRFVAIADIHVIIDNEEVIPEDAQTVKDRVRMFSNTHGRTSTEIFEALMKSIDSMQADAVLFAGDILDYYSIANWEFMENALKQLETPYIFVGADHDHVPYYANVDASHMEEHNRRLEEYPISVLEFDDLVLVGVDNNTSQITERGLQLFRDEIAKNKPIILMAHVPFQSTLDRSLDEESRKVWQDRSLIWGENTYYEPDSNTAEFLELVYSNNSPVKYVVGGHLHFIHRGKLTENTEQLVLPQGAEGIITVIHVQDAGSTD